VTRSTKWFVGLMIAGFAVIFVFKTLEVYTNYLWMDSLGQRAVFSTMLWTKVGLALVVGVLFAVWLWINVRISRRPLPTDITFIGRRLLPDEEREQIEQYADTGLLVFVIFGGVMAALVASGRWLDWQMFANAVPFNLSDPLFGKDVGFYVFKLPFIQYAWRTVYYSIVIALVVSILIYLYMEAIRIVGNTVQAIPRARAHCMVLLAAALFAKIYGYRLAQYNLLYSQRGGNFFGASYADVHARLPVYFLMMALVFAAGIIMLVSIRGRSLRLPMWALAVILVTSVLGGSIYPGAIQKMVVEPVGPLKERPYISFNIKATNHAFGLDKVETRVFQVEKGKIDAELIEKNPETINNIRLWDHRPLQRTYDRQQTFDTPFYHFVDVDVDRYTVGGKYQQVMICARQIDHAKLPSRTWVNEHLVYTHGYGVCLSPVHEKTPEGLPYYWIYGIPPQGPPELKITRPQLYYQASVHPRLIEWLSPPERPTPPPRPSPGESQDQSASQPQGTTTPTSQVLQTDFVIVNSEVPEFDYPVVSGGPAVVDKAETRYNGRGGVPINGLLRRLAFAARFRSKDLLFTTALQEGSKIIFNHLLPEGLMPLAPFLIYDPDPYIVIIDGKLQWINDAYTYSTLYPYSKRVERPLPPINYIRNSIKVVVDAYDGIPTFYVVDPTDPLVKCYQKIFPTLFTDGRQMTPQLRKHLRYPQLLFTIQAQMYCDYHMTDPDTFYRRADSWAMPIEKYADGRRMMEAYYVIMKLPEEDKEEFLLMLPFTPAHREERNMVAWMAARCDGEQYGKLLAYRFPKQSQLMGPLMAEAAIDQETDISSKFTLWGQGGSRVIRGNLLIIPIDHNALYVEPIFIEAYQHGEESESSLPQLKAVVVLYEDRVVMRDTLSEALNAVFGSAAVKPAPVAGAVAQPPRPRVASTARQLIQKAIELDAEARSLLSRGDLAGYQKKQQEQLELLKQLQKVIEQ